MTQTNIKQILDMLNTLEEQLLSLPDDMLLSIDPLDNDVLPNKVIKGIKTCISLYISTPNHLNTINPTAFALLLKNEKFTSKRDNPLFTVTGKDLEYNQHCILK